ncbi:MAG: VOC family protein [Pseudomonadota bacterium]
MRFCGIDGVTFGVTDIAECQRFWRDWGLAQNSEDDTVFTTLDGSRISLRPADDATLPAPFEEGSTARQIVWGLEDEAALAEARDALQGQSSFVEGDGWVGATDPNGMGLKLQVTTRHEVEVVGSPTNTADKVLRKDERSPVYEKAQPIGIGHVVFFTADIMTTLAFYTEVLGFTVSDSYPQAGYFLRCRQEGGHHNLFLLKTPDGKRGLNHVAFTVRDIHEVFGGGIHMSGKGWPTQIGPGRHPISSAYFWYFHNPSGGLAEYYANEDYCTKAWQPREWQRSAANYAEWAVNGGIDGETRRQIDKR